MGQEFTANDEDPYCLDCFGNLYGKKCTACAKPITGKFHIVLLGKDRDYVHVISFFKINAF